jgi:hypothetical protein
VEAAMAVPLLELELFVFVKPRLIDYIMSCIRQRFDQPGYRVYKNFENILLKGANNDDYSDEYQLIRARS